VPRDHVVLYQFSARGHEVAQAILGSFITHPHDGVGAYYRSRPLLLALGLTLEDAHASPLGRSGGFSDGRDIGVVCNMPNENGPVVLPMSGDVGSQFTPAAGWAQAIQYHRHVLRDASWDGAMAVVAGGDGSVATNGFWSALTMATTLKLPLLFYIEDNGLGISVPRDFQTPDGNIAANLASFGNLLTLDGDGSDPEASITVIAQAVSHVRGGAGPALVRLTVPRLSSHSGPDNQKGYRSDADIAADWKRDPLPHLRSHLLAQHMKDADWRDLEARAAADVEAAMAAARSRPAPDPEAIRRFAYAEALRAGDTRAQGGLTPDERAALGGTRDPEPGGPRLLFAEAVRRTLRTELARNAKVLVFGEDVGVKGGVHLVTEGL
jgi:2-oxoisovalerate dehydrogenase E1 component